METPKNGRPRCHCRIQSWPMDRPGCSPWMFCRVQGLLGSDPSLCHKRPSNKNEYCNPIINSTIVTLTYLLLIGSTHYLLSSNSIVYPCFQLLAIPKHPHKLRRQCKRRAPSPSPWKRAIRRGSPASAKTWMLGSWMAGSGWWYKYI